MRISLVYHSPDQPRNKPSPFEEALASVTQSGSRVVLASPYLSLSVLRSVVDRCSQFCLLTDAEEWIRTTAKADRREVIDFCDRYKDQVRHVRDLHAKVVATDRLAMVGSANLTTSGLTVLEEMSVLLTEPDVVAQVIKWHTGLWDRAAVIDANSLRGFAQLVPDPPVALNAYKFRLPGLRPIRRSRRQPSPLEKNEATVVAHLVALKTPEKSLRAYLDIVKLLYGRLGLRNDDPRLSFTLPKTGNMPLSINNRWVLDCLKAKYRLAGPLPLRLTIPAKFIARHAKQWHGGLIVGQFRNRSAREPEAPLAVVFDDLETIADSRICDAWLEGCRVELARGNRSPNRKYHSPILLRTALEPGFRQHILAQVYR